MTSVFLCIHEKVKKRCFFFLFSFAPRIAQVTKYVFFTSIKRIYSSKYALYLHLN